MKALLTTISLFLLALLLMPAKSFAQTADTLDVAVLPVGNINTVINGDTLAGGVRAHPNRVYRLKRQGIYQLTEPIKINGNIIVYAPAGTDRPPVLMPAILADGSSIDHFFNLMGKGGKAIFMNLYLLSFRSDNAQLGWSTAIRLNADSINLKMRKVIIDGFTEAGIRQYSKWSSIDVQDCNFRNMQHSSSYFGGQPFMTDGLCSNDSVKFYNNTFFANNSYTFSIRGYDKFAAFEHNSLVYGIVNPFLMRQAYNLRMDNNLFYAMHAYGGIPEHVRDTWFLNYPDTLQSSIIFLRAKTDTVDGNVLLGEEAFIDTAGHVLAPMVDPKNRFVEIENNSYFFPQKLIDFYKQYNDTVKTTDIRYGVPVKRTLTMAAWIEAYTQNNIDNVFPKVSPNVTVKNNTNADPGFNADINNHIDKVNEYIAKIATNKLDKQWFYGPATQYPVTWPLPENLAYSNTALQTAGKDGLPLGDLNWFPEKKKLWREPTTGVEMIKSTQPSDYKLSQNYPNPFNPETKIEFAMRNNGMVKLVVYNILGQAVRTLVNEDMKAGTYSVSFNGRDNYGNQLASGMYIYSLETSSMKITKKMMLLK
ncbi:MAG TPA: FlgD immunoglobulin-like domain containing protein [Ignavibacteriales bacterium]|nr:FlgD immunoglobulin-like domain containing protein [Ignavibacteriales bacterium]